MTVMELFGCAFLALGPPLAMFLLTIVQDPVKIIVLTIAAFSWLLSLLLSALLWFVVVPFRKDLVFGLIISVIFQEMFRYIIYKLIRKSELSLKKVTDKGARLVENRHILAYVSGLGFGIMSGAFSLANVLADAIGPGAMGLKSGTEMFFLSSAAISLCFILLHTFWSVIFFSAMDKKNLLLIAYVVLSHLTVSCLTLINRYQSYCACLVPLYLILGVTGYFAFRVAGGSCASNKNCR